MQKRPKFLLCLVGFLFYLISAKPAYAICAFELRYPHDLVVAELEKQKLHCEPTRKSQINYFKTLKVLRGKVNQNFEISTSAYDKCPKEETKPSDKKTIDLAPGQWAGAPPEPKFLVGKKYILSLHRADKLPLCDRIVREVSGVYDPRVLLATIKVYSQPLWMIGLLLTLLLTYTIGSFIGPESPLTVAIGAIVTIIIYGAVAYFVFKLVRVFIRKLKRKLKSPRKNK